VPRRFRSVTEGPTNNGMFGEERRERLVKGPLILHISTVGMVGFVATMGVHILHRGDSGEEGIVV